MVNQKQNRFITDWGQVPVIIDVPYISKLLGVSNEYARQLVSNGIIKAFKVGNLWRIEKSALKEYIENGGQS